MTLPLPLGYPAMIAVAGAGFEPALDVETVKLRFSLSLYSAG